MTHDVCEWCNGRGYRDVQYEWRGSVQDGEVGCSECCPHARLELISGPGIACADAAEKLADWKKWTRGSDLSGPCGSARLDYATNVDGRRELKLWLNWFCGLSLIYVLDESAVQVAA